MTIVSKMFASMLIFASVVMACWGTLGFLEYFTGMAVVMPLQNVNFPDGTQFLHWLLISVSGYTLLIGFFMRWKHTPNVMVVLFTCLATMCFIQTFDFMTREDRYTAYAREVTYYIVFSIYLLKSRLMNARFRRSSI